MTREKGKNKNHINIIILTFKFRILHAAFYKLK